VIIISHDDMVTMWRSVPSVAVIVFCREPELRFLILERTPEVGHMFLPVTGQVEGDEGAAGAAVRALEKIGIKATEDDLVDIGHKLTYYARETKYEQSVLALEAPPDLDLGGKHKDTTVHWASFESALRMLTLTAYKKAIIKALSERIAPRSPVALGSVDMFDHVPVSHPSGMVILCDFDGTVTVEEASIRLLKAFAPAAWERYEKAWLEKKLTTHECLGLQFTIITAPFEELCQYVAENVELRQGFAEFVSWCHAKGHGLVITSSGIDFYIKAILERHDLGAVPFLANRGIWVKDQGLVIEEGMVNEDCDQCGNCKTRLVEQYQARGARVVFVGDGITDECAASKADTVFARRSLLEFCIKEGVECKPFEDFNDILKGLEAQDD